MAANYFVSCYLFPGALLRGTGREETLRRLSQVPSLPKSNMGMVSVRLILAFHVHAAYRFGGGTVSSGSALGDSVTGLTF